MSTLAYVLAPCLLLLLLPPTALYKGFVNKKISDTINGVNAAGTAAQGLITNKGSLLGDRSKTLMGFITNLKQYVAAEAKDTVSDVCRNSPERICMATTLILCRNKIWFHA
jgi:hypothetical protein